MTGEAALKAAHFVQLCSQRDVPLVFLQNVTLPLADETSRGGLQQGLKRTILHSFKRSEVPESRG